MSESYPISLDLSGRSCVIIGGQSFMVRKVQSLRRANARVMVISPNPCAELTRLASLGEITLHRRDYQPGDLDGAFLALNTDRGRATLIREEATQQGTLLNTVNPEDSDFSLPAIHRSGYLSIAVSTSGIFPALAVQVRDELAGTIGPEYAQFLEWLAAIRAEVMRHVSDYTQRRIIWHALVESDVLAMLRQSDEDGAWQRLRSIVESHLNSSREESVT